MRYPMTVEGAKALELELKTLLAKRPEIAEKIATARELGDLKENAEYHSAREEQGLMEARIKDIEGRIQNSQIIDITKIPASGKVVFGTTVQIIDVDTEETKIYKIVGEDEADVKINKISNTSPIAKSLMGKSQGDIVEITTPGGKKEFEIESISHI